MRCFGWSYRGGLGRFVQGVMAVMNGIPAVGTAAIAWLVTACVVGAVPRTASAACGDESHLQQAPDELEKLRAMLEQAGPDGKDARTAAVERLLGMRRREAHQILQAQLLRQDDGDGVRILICEGLQRHLVGNPSAQFGGLVDPERRRILTEYLRVLAPSWRGASATTEDADPLRNAARAALQRVPARELDTSARVLLAEPDVVQRVAVLRCLADMQQTLFTTTIAEYLQAIEPEVRIGARDALQLLTCHDEPIATKAQFDAWFARFGSMRYVDLVERAARLGTAPLTSVRDALARLRVDAAREVVRAHVSRTPGIDWAAVQAKVVVDEPGVLDACLELLQQALPDAPLTDDGGVARQGFCRALLQRFRQTAPDQVQRRSRLLEVAAYLGRAEDGELATELVALLLAQLDGTGDVDTRLAALRGLRRFPSVETRGKLVACARQMFEDPAPARAELTTILATLGSRAAPRWSAPSAGDPDHQTWLALVTDLCRSDPALELREAALELAQTVTATDQRVPEVFRLLCDLVRDQGLGTRFRATCAIHLQGWRNEATVAVAWVQAEQELLRDAAPELRQLAAESLGRLTESIDPRRSEWMASTIMVLRERLPAETEPAVQRAMVDCLQVCGREPQMPEKAIGALRMVLANTNGPMPTERLEPLLQALATIAADPHADRGQWLAACQPLIHNRKRQSLRLVLQSHAAAEMAKDVVSADGGIASRASQAMVVLIETALLKPPREAWSSSEELMREARDVRAAFAALDTLDEALRPDEPKHRLLRLEVDLAAGKHQDVVQRAGIWLANGGNTGAGNGTGGANGSGNSPDRKQVTVEDANRMRLLMAEAQLALGKADAARKLIDERGAEPQPDPAVLDLEFRVARALVATDPAGAVALFERALRGTPVDDPTFRVRLLEWTQHRLRFDPEQRADTLREAAKYANLFASPDCPPDLRNQFDQLRAQR